MLTDFQRRKMIKLFQFWDINNNGALEKTDYQEIADRIAAERGWEKDSQEYANMYNTVMANWGQVAQFADENKNGLITLDEWLAYCEQVATDPNAYRINAMEVMMVLLNAADRNSDGQLYLSDYEMWFRVFKADENDAETAFYRLDTDKSGVLSIEEIIKALDDFYHSSAESAPGNFLFGNI